MKTILVAEDQMETRLVLQKFLTKLDYSVLAASDGLEAIDLFMNNSPDIVLLDVKMPRMDGWQVLELIRSKDSNIPIMMVTGLSDSEVAVKGLNLGADDYIRKPYDLEELAARIKTISRRLNDVKVSDTSSEATINVGPYNIDDRSKEVFINGTAAVLSPKEYQLFYLMASDPGKVFSAKEIIQHMWPTSSHADEADVKQYIHLLRKRLKSVNPGPQHIETVKGFGYKLAVE